MPVNDTTLSENPFREFLSRGKGSMVFEGNSINPVFAPVVDVLQRAPRKELNLRQRRLDRAVDELGLQYSDTSSRQASANPWRLDLFPLALTEEAWSQISAGVVQRALAFNAYATDIHADQDILRQKCIPHAIALQDPAFLRQLSGIEVPNGEYSQFGAFDLVDTVEGGWQVVENHMGMPFGVSHVLQNRRILSQVFPELYEASDIAPVATFSTYLLEMLRAQSPKKNPHILLLTCGLPGQAYFEETFIARHMGISIAQPSDLIVRESNVFLKTIRGLELVDVIYRRVESAALDPIAVPNIGLGGVSGLINVLRKGNVSIVNAPGAGVADNRALLRYSDSIIKYYLKESPVLKTIKSFNLTDVDQRAHYEEYADSMIVKPIQDHDSLWQRFGGKRPSGTVASMDKWARKSPDFFVAQSLPEIASIPLFREGRFDAATVYLRVYYILGAEPIVLPGGMALRSAPAHRTRRLTIAADGLKDVWVPDKLVEDSPPKRRQMAVGERFSIGSRVAEALYWAGRYIERAEATARQFNTLEQLRWDQLARSEQRTYWPLLQAVAAATGHVAISKLKRPPRDTLKFSKSLLLDASEGASVRACIETARNGLKNVRELISPECWEVLEEMRLDLRAQANQRITRTRLRQLCERIVSEVARFNGTAERTLPHDDGWQFYRAGIFFERAIGTLSLLEVALPQVVKSYRAKDEENADLTALLRLLGSLDAYRREFRSRAYVDRVSRLIVTGKNNPSSISFCLRHLHYAIGTLSISGERELGKGLQAEIKNLIESLDDFSLAKEALSDAAALDAGELEKSIQIKPKEIAGELDLIKKRLETIHKHVEDIFFSHQDTFAHDPVLFEID